MGALDLVKKHPVATGVTALVVFGGVLVVMSSGGTPAETGGTVSEVSAGTEMQQLAQAYQLQMGSIQAQVQDKAGDREAAITLAQIAAQSNKEIAGIQANIAAQQISAEQQTTSLISTLTAGVQTKSIEADLTKELTRDNNMTSVLNNQTAAMVAINKMMADTQKKAIDKQCSGFFDCLF